MDPVLIVLRGNAVTGKTSVASALQERLGTTNVMLVQQDITEKHIDTQILMIQKLVNYGKKTLPLCYFGWGFVQGSIWRNVT
ncbi:hypothetical protein AKUA2103_01570 [Apilactobacillus kunkeei]|nr:hypothetical protein AKUA2103_01570 [Apilactobacillus kunkeei]